jgi:WhiB family transcriptional regulator, redox-sensing transcriptional regulator
MKTRSETVIPFPAPDELAAFTAGHDHDADSPGNWRGRALCAETDPEAFFPEKGGSSREAKKVCRGCEVRAECLDFALENDERFGVWGGMSERERRQLLKENAA